MASTRQEIRACYTFRMPSPYDLYKNGKTITPKLPVSSLFDLLQSRAKKHPNKTAITYVDINRDLETTTSNAELLQIVLRLAKMLKTTYHFQPGDAIALNLHNTPEILYFHLAAWISGFITVPLDLKRDDLDRKIYKLQATHCKLLVSVDDDESANDLLQLKNKLPNLQILSFAPEKGIVSKLPQDTLNEKDVLKNSNRTSLILFTSGTTALPKGVQLSVANILYNADGINEWMGITKNDVFHIVLPLHHINSTTFSVSTLLAGGSIVLVSRYSKSKFWEVMAKYHCTMTSIVPTICFDQLTEQASFQKHAANLKQVRRIQIGSAPVQPTDCLQFAQQFDIQLVQGFGLTETALRISGFFVDDVNKKQYQSLVALNTIGHELKWNNLAVLKADGSIANEEEEGEICARGPVITKGYLDNKKADAEAFTFGWFHTGDLGYWKTYDNKQYFFTNGRSKEIIIKGGVNISPLTIENAILKQFPEITSCYAVPYPNKRYGEDVGVVVTLRDGLKTIDQQKVIDALKTAAKKGKIHGISAYESPSHILLVRFDQLPKTSTGKVQRVVIRSYMRDMLTPIAETGTHIFRKLTPFDDALLLQGVEIHNSRWGTGLEIDLKTMTAAAENGVVLGAIEKSSGTLVGSVFAEQVSETVIKKPAPWMQTYAEATSHLILKRHNPLGDALLLVSISTQGKPIEKLKDAIISDEAAKKIQQYLNLHIDPVLSFHEKAKGGLSKGAEIIRILANARPEDVDALGYNVLMQYPSLTTQPTTNTEASLGTQLVEASLLFAYQHKLKTVYAYSRPAGFRSWLNSV